MVIICWNRRVTRRSQACLTFSLFMERRWVKIKMRERKLISSPGRQWKILEDSGWINHDVCEAVLKRSHWWDSDHRLENWRGGGGVANTLMIAIRRFTVFLASNTQGNIQTWLQYVLKTSPTLFVKVTFMPKLIPQDVTKHCSDRQIVLARAKLSKHVSKMLQYIFKGLKHITNEGKVVWLTCRARVKATRC